jgi:enoyl-CoA hydratase
MRSFGTDELTATRHGRVCTLVLNNQGRRNALSQRMLEAIPEVLRECSSAGVRVVVLRGAGGTFCSGADLSGFDGDGGAQERFAAAYTAAVTAVARHPQPVVAAVQGACVGGGLRLALAADMRWCDTTARFGVTAARIGLAYGDVAELLLAAGPAWAADLLITGRLISGAEALRAGLVSGLREPGEFDASVSDLAEQIAANAPLAVAAHKYALRDAAKPPAERDPARVAAMINSCRESSDFAEVRLARGERRAPRFEGR